MAYPFTRVTPAEVRAKAAAKKTRKAEKRVETADLSIAAASQAFVGGVFMAGVAPKPHRTPVRAKKRRKKSLFVRLRDALDDEGQDYAKERDEPLGCRIRKAKNCTGKSECGYHIQPRGKWPTRWDLDFMGIGNIVGACNPCNDGEHWWRLTYAGYHREIFGGEFCDALHAKAHDKHAPKHTSITMQAKLDDIRARRMALKGVLK